MAIPEIIWNLQAFVTWCTWFSLDFHMCNCFKLSYFSIMSLKNWKSHNRQIFLFSLQLGLLILNMMTMICMHFFAGKLRQSNRQIPHHVFSVCICFSCGVRITTGFCLQAKTTQIISRLNPNQRKGKRLTIKSIKCEFIVSSEGYKSWGSLNWI